jgi:hypothetical protein
MSPAPGHVRRGSIHIRLLHDPLLISQADSRRYTRYYINRPGSCLVGHAPGHDHIIARVMSDVGAFTFVSCMIPFSYIWEILVVTRGIMPTTAARVMSPAPGHEHIMPRVMSDVGAFAFVSCMLPFSYILEILIVTPGMMS